MDRQRQQAEYEFLALLERFQGAAHWGPACVFCLVKVRRSAASAWIYVQTHLGAPVTRNVGQDLMHSKSLQGPIFSLYAYRWIKCPESWNLHGNPKNKECVYQLFRRLVTEVSTVKSELFKGKEAELQTGFSLQTFAAAAWMLQCLQFSPDSVFYCPQVATEPGTNEIKSKTAWNASTTTCSIHLWPNSVI